MSTKSTRARLPRARAGRRASYHLGELAQIDFEGNSRHTDALSRDSQFEITSTFYLPVRQAPSRKLPVHASRNPFELRADRDRATCLLHS